MPVIMVEGRQKQVEKGTTFEAIAKEYQAMLQTVDKSITATITETAKAKGYNMVISKGVVVYGADDITEDVQKVVK